VSSHQFAYAHKRRSTRIAQAIPLVVQGVGAMREPYHEEVSTVAISCHGCTYQSRHEVIQGEIVFLDIKKPSEGPAGCSNKARVKWAQKLGGKERAFQIAVELEIAGNVWGIPTPPDDWFPPRIPDAADPAATGRELKVVGRKEQQIVLAPEGGTNRLAPSERIEPAKSAIAPLAQLMVGLGEQIQAMASEAASAALTQEKGRLMEEFRAQLREEAGRTVEAAITASKDAIVQQAMKEFSEAQEAGARNSYALWIKKVQQDMESARQHLLKQGQEMSQRLDTMAASSIERVQHSIEASRTDAVDRFVARLREQIVPMLSEAKESLQKLQGAELALRKESDAIFAGLENQLAFSTNEILAKSQEELEKNRADIATRAGETLQKLSQDFESAARNNANLLLAAVGSDVVQTLQQKVAEASQEFSNGLDGYAKNYLESLGKSIAEIPQKMPGRPRQ
jgi:hypothetical protein